MQRFRSVPLYKSPFPLRLKTRGPVFTAETVAQRNGPIFAKQALTIPWLVATVYCNSPDGNDTQPHIKSTGNRESIWKKSNKYVENLKGLVINEKTISRRI